MNNGLKTRQLRIISDKIENEYKNDIVFHCIVRILLFLNSS